MYKQVDQHGYISWQNPENQTWNQILNSNYRQQLGNSDNRFGFFHFVSNMNIMSSKHLDQISADNIWVGPEQYYQNSYLDLVSETHDELYGNVFLTEKSFKPLAYGIPFIFNASRYYVAQLQRLGYESFPELFDESYDQMPASLEKIKFIADQVVNFCSTDKINFLKNSIELQQKIKHNQELFWNKNHAQLLGELLYKVSLPNET
jgi:hypothetical protein